MSQEKLQFILEKYINGKLLEEERQWLHQVLSDNLYQIEIGEIIMRELEAGMYTMPADERKFDLIYKNLIELRQKKLTVSSIQIAGKQPLIPRKWFFYAATIVLALGAGIYFWLSFQAVSGIVQHKPPVKAVYADVLPGDNRATLTLGDGSIIVLDSASNGSLARQGNTRIVKLNNGELMYSTGHLPVKERSSGDQTLLYNTISTPRGGLYEIVLPDRSRVWLNAASSIRFPTIFNGSERRVEISGEVYFEVAENKQKPFIVMANGTLVKALGTAFNVNAYSDEAALKATLLEGSVSVTNGITELRLLPGEQARVKEDKVFKNTPANAASEVAWKEGLFKFNHAAIEPIMRQISRWYDVEVVYEGTVTDRFVSTIPRNVPVSQVLKALQLAGGVHFEIIGKKIIVRP